MSRDNILDRIMIRKAEEVSESRRQRSESELLTSSRSLAATRGFAKAISDQVNRQAPAVIAEIKRASPSKGLIIPDPDSFNPAHIASGYQQNGATCISCLTDRDFFQGDEKFIQEIKDKIDLPVLRKDFIFDTYQVVEARAIGADAILLIMAVLSRPQAQELEAAAIELGLDVLVEVHNEDELEAAHDLKTTLMGINNRNLKTFKTSLDVSMELAARTETNRIVVSESGINSQEDIKKLQANNIHAYLIGTAFMKSSNPGVELGKLLDGFIINP
ncbi:MAG: indole-3-glycerol phosphate synthase TrpC [Magnetococcales bacterium]|nr:indole-3-glycerol phosphate synthase TrpC [Magnetococcales bacterium]